MAENDNKEVTKQPGILSQEQDAVLDLYIQHLDGIFEEMKMSEKLQVEIETQHLKRILTK
ncbi:hypothetical protein [Pontibacter roseus]|uniref:hypothetical protein n=1 Tax=Pontibacter roseus TaxID=336989 RepID=UPI00035F99ED|nr:hypothetical protein [Pontibacter roseus]